MLEGYAEKAPEGVIMVLTRAKTGCKELILRQGNPKRFKQEGQGRKV